MIHRLALKIVGVRMMARQLPLRRFDGLSTHVPTWKFRMCFFTVSCEQKALLYKERGLVTNSHDLAPCLRKLPAIKVQAADRSAAALAKECYVTRTSKAAQFLHSNTETCTYYRTLTIHLAVLHAVKW